MNRRKFLAGVSVAALLSAGFRGGLTTNILLVPAATWFQAKIGGGGFVTGIDISNDRSVIVCRTDTAGVFIWNAVSSSWKPLITAVSFAGQGLDNRQGGCVEIRVAPNNPSIIYMSFQGDIWVSTDTGATWTATKLTYSLRNLGVAEANAQSGTPATRLCGQKMIVDPANPDVVYYGAINTKAGVWFTTNGTAGASAIWTQISTSIIPAGAVGIFGMAFDPTSGTTGGKTKTIYIPVSGVGVYQSTDAGSTWALLNSTGMPTGVCCAKVGVDGTYYAATNASLSNSLYKYTGGAWTNISSGAGHAVQSIVCDPSDVTGNRIVAMDNAGWLQLSSNKGGSWATQISTVSRTSTQLTWLNRATVNNNNPSDVLFDGSGNIWMSYGLGVQVTPFSGSPTSTVWNTDYTIGIENLTTNQVLYPPSGTPLLAGWDQSVFRITNPQTFSTTHSPTSSGTTIHMAWGLDWATSNPSFIAYISTWASDPWGWFSTDGGQTWTQFSGAPTGGNIPIFSGGVVQRAGGCVACSTPLNMVFVPSGDALPWYTKDGGATWTEIVLGTLPTSGETGWGHANFQSAQVVAADRVTPNCFYMYNYRSTGDGKSPSYTGIQSLYRSTDSGDTWTLMNSASIDTQAIAGGYQLVSVPGNAGHLFFSGGFQGTPDSAVPGTTRLHRSTDGGATWTLVGAAGTANGAIKMPLTVGVGAAKPGGGGYPAVYFIGWLYISGSPVFGFYRSDDNCLTWSSIGDYSTLPQLGNPHSIDGSKTKYGEVYVGMGSGESYIYRTAD